MRAEDLLLPSFREHGAQLWRGVTPEELFLFWGGDERGSDFAGPREDFPVCVPIATHAPHAVGVALSFKLRREKRVAVCVFGDGATSKGDVAEALNVAGVWHLPVVFVINNNRWAISVPLAQQTVAPIWKKAEAYGFPGVQVDGNDVLAVYQVTKEAADRAKTEGTPTLIEALTYRLAPHSTADDASRYQPAEEIERWKTFDPIERYRRFLDESGVIDDEFVEECEREAAEEMKRLRQGVIGSEPRPVAELFEWIFEGDLPIHLERQRREVLGDG
jgi:pyruvate dehydrogenase E1 component alpha subunit